MVVVTKETRLADQKAFTVVCKTIPSATVKKAFAKALMVLNQWRKIEALKAIGKSVNAFYEFHYGNVDLNSHHAQLLKCTDDSVPKAKKALLAKLEETYIPKRYDLIF